MGRGGGGYLRPKSIANYQNYCEHAISSSDKRK